MGSEMCIRDSGEIIRDNGYIKFQNPTNKKWIARYADLLDKADKSGKISKDKIKKIRTMFQIKQKREPEGFLDLQCATH